MKINTIMLVDDNETDQFLHEIIVQKFDPDIEVIKAYDGQEALDIMASLSQPPDAILLDINMPGLNGFEFLDRLCANTACSTVIALLSSSDQTNDRTKALSYRCVEKYFLKPLNKDHLKILSEM